MLPLTWELAQKYDLHIFNLDDTLVSTTRTYLAAARQLLRENCHLFGAFREQDENGLREIIQSYGSSSPRGFFTHFASKTDRETKKRICEISEEYLRTVFGARNAQPGAIDYLNQLSQSGKKTFYCQ